MQMVIRDLSSNGCMQNGMQLSARYAIGTAQSHNFKEQAIAQQKLRLSTVDIHIMHVHARGVPVGR